MVLPQPVRPQSASGLFVCGDHQQHITAQRNAVPGQELHHQQARGDLALHVERPPAPHTAVRHLTGEGRTTPLLRLGADDIGMAQQHQRRLVSRPGQPGDQIRPPGLGLQHGVPDAGAGEFPGEIARDGDLVSRRVRGVQADQRREMTDQVLLLVGPTEGQGHRLG
ncbi:hypothetical protein NLX86_10315 [Streptomyces sp. A3M-1-3]|nr:hypothetical protein [Streptomyces sp. A3M-1-3]MCP3818496.1 hypothetical protein [Streptomyces sp. A3M-1-3]